MRSRVWFIFVTATLLSASRAGASTTCTAASRSLGCADPQWIVRNGTLKCSTFGSESCVSELEGSGSSAYAYQELRVVPNVSCQISGVLYVLATCVGTCTPLVVVCPGKYTGALRCSLFDTAPVVASVVTHAYPNLHPGSQLLRRS
jgi:hypothetical protein